MSLTEAARETFFTELGLDRRTTAKLYTDNKGVLRLVENPVFHVTSKHVDIRQHFPR